MALIDCWLRQTLSMIKNRERIPRQKNLFHFSFEITWGRIGAMMMKVSFILFA
jgi:hypothetical protein